MAVCKSVLSIEDWRKEKREVKRTEPGYVTTPLTAYDKNHIDYNSLSSKSLSNLNILSQLTNLSEDCELQPPDFSEGPIDS